MNLYFISDCNKPLDIALLIDTSDLTPENSEKKQYIKQFIVRFIEYARLSQDGRRLAVMSYSSQMNVHNQLKTTISIDTASAVVDNWLESFHPGEKNLAGALDKVRRDIFFGPNGDRSDVPNLLIIVSSGRSNIRQTFVGQLAYALKMNGVTINGILLNNDDNLEMNDVVTEPADINLFPLQDSTELLFMPELILAQSCESKCPVNKYSVVLISV